MRSRFTEGADQEQWKTQDW